MGERSGVNILTLLLLIVLSVAAVLTFWWFERRFQSLETRLSRLERLDPKLERLGREFKNGLSGLQGLTEQMDAVQKAAAPLVRVDRSLDLLSEKVGNDIAPAVARISELATAVTNANNQLKSLSEALTVTQKQLTEQLDKNNAETAGTLKTQADNMQALFGKLEVRLNGVSEAQSKLSSELSGLETRLKGVSDAQGKLSGLTDELKTLKEELGQLTQSVESLKKSLRELDKKLSAPKEPGPAA